MQTTAGLEKLYRQMSDASNSQISLPNSGELPQSRNKLSGDYSRAKGSISEPNSDYNNTNNNNAAQSRAPQNSNVKEVDNKTRMISEITMKQAQKIVSMILYIASPMRLFVKIKANYRGSFMERVQEVNSIKVRDEIKMDLVSDWDNMLDKYGLMLLTKMKRWREKIYTQITNHEEYMACFKPNSPEAKNNPTLLQIATYLTRYALKYDTAVKQQYLQSRNEIAEYCESIEMGDWADQALNDLDMKLAWELNNSVNITKLRIKLMDGNVITKDVKEFEAEIHQLLNTPATRDMASLHINQHDPANRTLSQEMEYWYETDEPDMIGGKKQKKRVKKH
jgi:hypothetical protein